jgi:hypothetical protein
VGSGNFFLEEISNVKIPACGRQANVKLQNQWFDKRSTELTPKSHDDFVFRYFETVILSLSKDELWLSFEIDSASVQHFA